MRKQVIKLLTKLLGASALGRNRRQNYPQPIPQAGSSVPPVPPQMSNSYSGGPGQTPSAFAQAQNILTPRHIEEDTIEFTTIKDGKVVQHQEIFERKGNSLIARRIHSAVLTASNSITSPANIVSRCSECGGYCDIAAFCNEAGCSRSLCLQHAHVIDTPTGSLVLCKRHLNATVGSWNVWSQMDAVEKGEKQVGIFPSKPYSLSKVMSQDRKKTE